MSASFWLAVMTRGVEIDFAAAFGLRRRELEIEQVVGAENREAEAAGRIRDRHVDVEAISQVRHRDATLQARLRLRGNVAGARGRQTAAAAPVDPGAGTVAVVEDHVVHLVGAERGARRRDHVAVVGLVAAADAELDAELACERVARDDDARFDQHLLHRAIEDRDELADFLDLRRDVADQQNVRAVVEGDAAATRRGSRAAAGRPLAPPPAWFACSFLGQQRRDVLRLAVADRDVVGDERLLVLDLEARIGDRFFAVGDFLLRRDPDHVAAATLVEALGLQDDVERLVPRHVDETQRDVALHASRRRRC